MPQSFSTTLGNRNGELGETSQRKWAGEDGEDDEEDGPIGASPLGFFGAGRNPMS